MRSWRRVSLYSRALRWPFLSASVLPYIFGALMAGRRLEMMLFWLGLTAVASTHLSANLMNDVGDADTGADSRDPQFYGFFGGSKLIQEETLGRGEYQVLAVCFALLGAVCVLILAVCLRTAWIVAAYAVVILLSWGYTRGPWRLSYHGLGELAILLLFGPAVVLGSASLQGVSLTWGQMTQALPFGMLTAAILIANEVPDAGDDAKAGKRTIVVRTGPRHGHAVFAFIVLAALTLISWQTIVGMYGALAWAVWSAFPAAGLAWRILKQHWTDKHALVRSSRLAVLLHAWVSAVLIADKIMSP